MSQLQLLKHQYERNPKQTIGSIALMVFLTIGIGIFVFVSDKTYSEAEIDLMGVSFVAMIAGIGIIYMGYVGYQRRKLMENTPTSTTRGAAAGTVEVKGEVEVVDDEHVLTEPFGVRDVVVIEFSVDKRVESGNDYDWQSIVDDAVVGESFLIRDEEGTIRVHPEEGEEPQIKPSDVNSRTERVSSPENAPGEVQELLERLGIVDVHDTEGGFDTGKRRYSMSVLSVGDDAFVFGRAAPKDVDGNEELVVSGEGAEMFYLSDLSEEELTRGSTTLFVLSVVFGLLMSAGGLAAILYIA